LFVRTACSACPPGSTRNDCTGAQRMHARGHTHRHEGAHEKVVGATMPAHAAPVWRVRHGEGLFHTDSADTGDNVKT
jgi:hypothetical protein